MKGSRPILSFDASFNENTMLKLQKEIFVHSFNVPRHHPKSAPCVDRVFSWTSEDKEKIWLRQYEIVYEKAGKEVVKTQLKEIGPRIILSPMLILEGCMNGVQLYKNTELISLKKVGL